VKINIFVSAKEKDTGLKQEIIQKLENCNKQIEKIEISKNKSNLIKNKIKESLKEADIFILILDRKENLQWLYFEIGMAFILDIPIMIIYNEKVYKNFSEGVFEDIFRVNMKENICEKLEKFINDQIFKDKKKLRKLISKNFSPIRYFPLEKNLICGISKTSLEVESYFLEIPKIEFKKEGLYFNGRFYLKQFIKHNGSNGFTFTFWFKINEDINLRFSKYVHKNEPIFLLTFGNLERKTNKNLGIYFGRPSIESKKIIDNGLRIFTYCQKNELKEEGIESCDSQECYKNIYKNKWFFCGISWEVGNKPILYIYDKEKFLKKIEGNYNIMDSLNESNFLMIGGGFPYSKVYIVIDDKNDLIFVGSKKDFLPKKFYTSSKLHLKNCFSIKRNSQEFDEKSWINLQPYKLPLIDGFRFIGYIRELMMFNSQKNEKEIKSLWKKTKSLL